MLSRESAASDTVRAQAATGTSEAQGCRSFQISKDGSYFFGNLFSVPGGFYLFSTFPPIDGIDERDEEKSRQFRSLILSHRQPSPHLKSMISVITGNKKQSEIIKHLFIFAIPPFPGFFCIKISVLNLK